MSSINQRAKNKADQGIIARYALPTAPQPNTTPASQGIPEPSSLFDYASVGDWISYLAELAYTIGQIRSRNLGPTEAWCILSPIKKGDGLTTSRFSNYGQAINNIYNDPNEISLAVIRMPYKKKLTIETAIRTPGPLVSPQTQIVNVEAVDFSSQIPGNRNDRIIDFLTNNIGAAAALNGNFATNAMMTAVTDSWSLFSNIQILQWSASGQFAGALSGALRTPTLSSAGDTNIEVAQKSGTRFLWLLAGGLALSPVPGAAIVPAGLALYQGRKK